VVLLALVLLSVVLPVPVVLEGVVGLVALVLLRVVLLVPVVL